MTNLVLYHSSVYEDLMSSSVKRRTLIRKLIDVSEKHRLLLQDRRISHARNVYLLHAGLLLGFFFSALKMEAICLFETSMTFNGLYLRRQEIF
jgi:hypothetical protein